MLFTTFLKAIHKYNVKHKIKTTFRVKNFLGNTKLKFLSFAYINNYLNINKRFLFKKKIYSALSFSLLGPNFQFNLISAIPIKHLTLNSIIGKYNTTVRSCILNVPTCKLWRISRAAVLPERLHLPS